MASLPRLPSMGRTFLLIFLEHFSQFWAKLSASPPSEPHQLHPKRRCGTGSAASNTHTHTPPPAPDVPRGFGLGGRGEGGCPPRTHDVMVRGEVEGVLVPQQPVVGVVSVTLLAIRAVVVVIQDLAGKRGDGGSEEDDGRPKPSSCSQLHSPHARRGAGPCRTWL